MSILIEIIVRPFEWIAFVLWLAGAFIMFLGFLDILESHYRMYKERRP